MPINSMENYHKNLLKAEENLKKVERLIVLSQVSKNKNLMLITLEEIEKAIRNCISSILHYDYGLKRVKLYKDSKLNFREFEVKSSKNFSIAPNEIDMIKEILNASKNHKNSPMEFMKKEEIIIMSDDQSFTKISMEKLTNFLKTAKNLLEKVKFKIKR